MKSTVIVLTIITCILFAIATHLFMRTDTTCRVDTPQINIAELMFPILQKNKEVDIEQN